MTTTMTADTVVLDVDGTLVDSVYVHVVAWTKAFGAIGTEVSGWRLHRAIGMGGDRLVAAVAGQRVEDAMGDKVREIHDQEYEDMAALVHPLPGADDLLALLRQAGFTVALASSASAHHAQLALDLLEGSSLAHGWVCSEDAGASKPAPDLIDVALAKVGGTHGVMVGDAVWDIEAANARSMPSIGLRCGGFCESELRQAGATAVFESPRDLVNRFEESGLQSRRD